MKQVSIPQSSNDMRTIMSLAQTEPVLLQNEDGSVVVLSGEDYELVERAPNDDLDRLCNEMTAEATANGMTEEILAQIVDGRGQED